MNRKLLISGERSGFTILNFVPGKGELVVIAEYPGPFNVSWVETSASCGDLNHLVGLSEGTGSGLIYTFDIDHAKKTCTTTSQKPTLGAPAHFITLRDSSALAVGTKYLGGSVALYPIAITEKNGLLFTGDYRTEFFPELSYKIAGHGPNLDRQRQCHVHQVLEDSHGALYAPDLGSDRVWILRRDQWKLEMCGWLQCPPGFGPRHGIITPSEKLMYVLGEMSHTIVAFDLSNGQSNAIQPIQGFEPKIIPPNVHADHQLMMDSAELCLHPTIPNVLYASNRWERHIIEREPYLDGVPKELPKGDAIAIILLSDDGRKVQESKFVRTHLDTIRGMRLSDDGKYVIACGQEGGGIEIYGISGERGDVWNLVASLNEGLESGIKHALWL